jgi:hypothetical protein
MSSLYLVPGDGNFSELTAQLERAGMSLVTPKTLRELIVSSSSETSIVAAIRPESMLILNRHASELLEELPEVVIGVLGLIYASEWYSLASTFPPVDWSELVKKTSKSGHTARNLDDVETRGNGSLATSRPEYGRDTETELDDDLGEVDEH